MLVCYLFGKFNKIIFKGLLYKFFGVMQGKLNVKLLMALRLI